MSAPDHFARVDLWCAHCHGYVEFEGPVYPERTKDGVPQVRKDSPVHITPDLLASHRETHS